MHVEPNEDSLTRIVEALPEWMEERHAAKILLEQVAQRSFPTFVRVPPQTIVIEETLLAAFGNKGALGAIDVPVISIQHKKMKWAGKEVIEHPVPNPFIRFLELDQEALKSLVVSGQTRRHWFKARGLALRANRWVLAPPTLRCIRPAIQTDSDTNRPARKLWSAVIRDDACEYSFSIDDVFIRSSDARALRHVIFKPAEEDPHRLFEIAPAVFAVYSAARKYALTLKSIRRGQAPADKKRLEEARLKVINHLRAFGKPFDGKGVLDQLFKFIDPKTPWGQGAPHKSFAEAAAAIEGFYKDYAYENFVTDGLGLIIYVAKETARRAFEFQQVEPGARPVPTHSVYAELEKRNFTGNDEIRAVATVILWRPKPKRKTASEKKPEPIARARR